MNQAKTGSFLERMRQWFFRWRTEREIFRRIFPHLRGEAKLSYPFDNDGEMRAVIEELDLQACVATVERELAKLPNAYRESLRYLMRRELHARLTRYARLAQRHLPDRLRTAEFAAGCS